MVPPVLWICLNSKASLFWHCFWPCAVYCFSARFQKIRGGKKKRIFMTWDNHFCLSCDMFYFKCKLLVKSLSMGGSGEGKKKKKPTQNWRAQQRTQPGVSSTSSVLSLLLKLWRNLLHPSMYHFKSKETKGIICFDVLISFSVLPWVHPVCRPDSRPWCDSPKLCRRRVQTQPVWASWRLPCRLTGPPGSKSPGSPLRCDMPPSPSAHSRGWWSFPLQRRPHPVERHTQTHKVTHSF